MGVVTVVGIGFSEDDITLGAVRALKKAGKILLHTGRCGLARWLTEQGIPFDTLDAFYEQAEDFDQHARMAAQAVLDAAREQDVVYAVFDVRDASVEELLRVAETPPKVLAGPPTEGALLAWTTGNVEQVAAAAWESMRLSPARDTLVREIADRQLASEVKLKLLECYPESAKAYALVAGEVRKIDLVDVDRFKHYDHTTAVLVTACRDLQTLERYDFDALNRVMSILRGPNGCPWDREQTHASLRGNLVEEAWETVDAINRDDPDQLCDELGDLLMQVCLHAEIARQHGEFLLSDVTTAICRKMISRHAHIFGSAKADSASEVLSLWQEQKKKERGDKCSSDALRSVAKGLPSLKRAQKLLARARDAGIQWDSTMEDAVKCFLQDPTEQRLGDVLMTISAVAMEHGLDGEIALGNGCHDFLERFCKMESLVRGNGGNLDAISPQEKKMYWNRVKLSEE